MANNQKVVLDNKSLDDIDIGDGITYYDDGNIYSDLESVNANTLNGYTSKEFVKTNDIINNLNSDSIDKPLSAAQGKELQNLIKINSSHDYVLLWKSPNGWTNSGYSTSSTIILNQDWTKFKELTIIYSHEDYRIPISQQIPSQFLKEFYLETGWDSWGWMLVGFSSQYAYLRPLTATSMYYTYGNGVCLFAIYGKN